MAKNDYQSELAHLCRNTSYRSAPLKAQRREKGVYVFTVMKKFNGDE